MPVEIRELLIKTTIEEKSAQVRPAANNEEGAAPAPKPAKSGNAGDRERLIKECVNIIMDNITSYSKER